MALRRVIYEGDPLLRKRSREIKEITDRIKVLAEDMWETLYDANGVGLAAPQVGVLRRLIVIDLPLDEEDEDLEGSGDGAEGHEGSEGSADRPSECAEELKDGAECPERSAGSGDSAEGRESSAGSGDGAEGHEGSEGSTSNEHHEASEDSADRIEHPERDGGDGAEGHESPEDSVDRTERPERSGSGKEESGGSADRTEETEACATIKFLMINPEIIEASEETLCSKEGCLSVPGMVGDVTRPARVKVRALDIEGNLFEVEGAGMLAKALQHEIDHLEGILYTDIAESIEEIKPEVIEEIKPE